MGAPLGTFLSLSCCNDQIRDRQLKEVFSESSYLNGAKLVGVFEDHSIAVYFPVSGTNHTLNLGTSTVVL